MALSQVSTTTPVQVAITTSNTAGVVVLTVPAAKVFRGQIIGDGVSDMQIDGVTLVTTSMNDPIIFGPGTVIAAGNSAGTTLVGVLE